MNIIVLGDSIAWGAFDAERGGWVERLKCFLFQYECFVYNCSVSGNTSKDVLNRMDEEISHRKDDIDGTGIIIAIGANDAGYDKMGNQTETLWAYQQNIQEIYKRCREVTENVIFVGLTPIDNTKTIPVSWDPNLNYSEEINSKYDEELEKFCHQNNVPFVSMKDMKKQYLTDGIHPDEFIHWSMFTRVKDQIKEWYQ